MNRSSEDVVMQDEVLESTEALLNVPDLGHDDDRKPASVAKPSFPTINNNVPALKGTGMRRDLGALPDKQLVARKDGPKPAKFGALPYATSQTGLVYDVRMRFHVDTESTHDDMHPEDPRRIHVIFEAFVNAGLAWREGQSGPTGDYYMGRIDTRLVTREEVCLVHTLQHWNWVQSLAQMNRVELKDELQYPPHDNDSIYLSTSTPYCAALSAGGAIEACRAVLLGKVKNVFAVIRPPGHHAEREDAKGFCFFDNVSIATKVCQREFGESCRKVFILDWDVHHGNGIQQAHYDDPNVLYISIHLHRKGTFYPESSYRDGRKSYGDHLHCGEGAGLGKNVNIPWTRQAMGDADYIYAFQQVVMPIATEFDPDLVIIAAGFDAAEGDMLGGCKVTPAGYAHMTHMLMSLANGRVAVCLEGGYNLESIARSACAVGRTLMGEPPDRLQQDSPTHSGVDDVKLVLRQQSRFWNCLYPKDLSARLAGPLHGVRMHNVVRQWQAETMFNEYSMTPLFIQRDSLAKEFENQVLATPNYAEQRPLLVILHDPPEVLASPDPRTGKIELHNTWLTDVVKTYVDWAVNEGFAVIDVNLPKHITDFEPDNQDHKEADSVENRIKEATNLLTYLWDNYIELNNPTHLVLMGTNTGHGAIVNFIRAHEEQAMQNVTLAISFVEDVPLLACKSQTNDRLPGWYYGASHVFVSKEHNFWASEYVRKAKKRFGKLVQSQQASISDMLVQHKDSVYEALSEVIEDWEENKDQEMEDEIRNALNTTESTRPGQTSPSRYPPLQNFAFSPKKPQTSSATVSPSRGATQPTTSGNGTPLRIPPGPSFASSPKP